jgi:hypothetical protein
MTGLADGLKTDGSIAAVVSPWLDLSEQFRSRRALPGRESQKTPGRGRVSLV